MLHTQRFVHFLFSLAPFSSILEKKEVLILNDKRLRSERRHRFWSQYGFQAIIIFVLIIVTAIFELTPAEKLFSKSNNVSHSSSSQIVASSPEPESFSSTLDPSEEGYLAGNSHGFAEGRSDGFDAGTSNGEQTPSDSLDFGETYESGYTVGYNRAYAKWWLSGYIDGYISQHPEIDEYELLDDILYTFPDADISDLIDYLKSAE